MASLLAQLYSDTLNTSVTVNVILPDMHRESAKKMMADGKLPRVLYLLHGYCDDYSVWVRRSSIERYVEDQYMVVVMPSVNHSIYCNEVYGEKYWDYVSEELPQLIRQYFRVSDKPEDTYVAGLSMGGYGAMRLALTHPERFAAAASFSGLVDVAYEVSIVEGELRESWRRAMGDLSKVRGSELDLFHLLDTNANAPRRPRLYVSCGTDDILYQHHLNFKEALKKSTWETAVSEIPHATHEWGFWDSEIQKFLKWALPAQ